MSGVAPTSTTAELAKDVPLEKAPIEKSESSDLPGSFPETPGPAEFSVNPLPAFEGGLNPIKLAPGEKVPDPSTLTQNTVTSQVREDPDLVAALQAAEAKCEAKPEPEQTFGVAPLPAFAGGVNPIKLAPGEKVPDPSTLTDNTIQSTVSENKELNGGASEHAPVLPPVVTPPAERELNGTGILDLPPVSKNLIPESSLPMGAAGLGTYDATPTIQSAGPQSTTAQLAAAVPLESEKVPEVVKESQEEAGFAPEASAVPAEVKEKSAVEKELLSEVPVAPTTSEGTSGEGVDKSENGVAAETAAPVTSEPAAKIASTPTPGEVTPAAEPAVVEPTPKEPEKLNAPASAPVAGKLDESREVSPGTVPGSHTQTEPTVTTGITSATTDKTTAATPSPVTPAKEAIAGPSTPSSSKAANSPASSAVADKKKKRTSFFGKLKAKLTHKEDKA